MGTIAWVKAPRIEVFTLVYIYLQHADQRTAGMNKKSMPEIFLSSFLQWIPEWVIENKQSNAVLQWRPQNNWVLEYGWPISILTACQLSQSGKQKNDKSWPQIVEYLARFVSIPTGVPYSTCHLEGAGKGKVAGVEVCVHIEKWVHFVIGVTENIILVHELRTHTFIYFQLDVGLVLQSIRE